MTDRERYLRAFSALQPSDDWMDRLEAAEPKKVKHHGRRLIAALAAAILIVGLIGAAYAADLGGIQGRVKLWHLGKLVNMDVEMGSMPSGDDGDMVPAYVFCNEDGEELYRIPVSAFEGMTAEEIIEEHSNSVDLETIECADGDFIVRLHYYDQTIDIRAYFDENCYGRYEGELSAGGHSQWVTVWRTEEEPWFSMSTEEIE